MGRWREMLENGTHATIAEIATTAEKINESYVGRVLRLTVLAPHIVEAILSGRQPIEMTLASASSRDHNRSHKGSGALGWEGSLREIKQDVSYETVRCWALKFGKIIVPKLRRCRLRPDRRCR